MPKRKETYFNDLLHTYSGLLLIFKYLGESMYLCKCNCGNEKAVSRSSLLSKDTQSCGCNTNKKHNKSKTSENRIWRQMKNRCYNKNNGAYKWYGGRGIKVCDRWIDKENGFINFYNDMGERLSPKHTLDRINVDGNYEKSNCRWATSKEQGNNKRNTIKIEYNGEIKSLKDWSEIYKIHPKCLLYRIKANWEIELALTKPILRK